MLHKMPLSTISSQHPIAFFCAEFGIDSRLPIYAGGLGVLAGDILKEAAEQKIPMVAVGLLYRGEGAIQKIDSEGMQSEANADYDPVSLGLEHVYLEDMPLFIKVHLTEVDVWVRCWKKTIGETVTLYLLDTETDQNHANERGIASALYAGTEEELIKQQLILGIGGIKLLHQLEIHPSLYHLNEGRPAFLHWQLIRGYMEKHGMSFEQASETSKAKTVYTNHTLLEAGNQSYTTHLLRAYGSYYAEKMGISIDRLLDPGMEKGTDKFSITRYALNTACKASAVSQLHYEFCKQRWPEYNWVGITNGVFMPFWQDPEIAQSGHQGNHLWHLHLAKKQQLAQYVQGRTGYTYDPSRLVISWSRRIAGYKRAAALFEDVQRLKKIISTAGKPVQILMAGKAHVFDVEGKQRIQQIIQYMQNELSGYALYIPNLDIELDHMLTLGSDVWLNTPEFGKEACGTSGMKALSNGVLQCTVVDGWTAEVKWEDVGWVLESENVADHLYTMLENEIVPCYYQQDSNGVPHQWLERMKGSIELSPQFSATRMMKEYEEKLYS